MNKPITVNTPGLIEYLRAIAIIHQADRIQDRARLGGQTILRRPALLQAAQEHVDDLDEVLAIFRDARSAQ